MRNDGNRIGSFERIIHYGATYLVTLEATSGMVKSAQAMTDDLPQVFLPQLLIAPDGPEAGGGVSPIDLEQAKAELGRRTSPAGR